MNSISIIGRLTADPELRTTGGGISVCSFSLAVKRPHSKDTTDFLNLTVWRQGAEFLSKYGHKGDRVGATGYLTQRTWMDNDGNKHYAFEILCDAVELLTSKEKNQGINYTEYSKNDPHTATDGFTAMEESDEELPF